MSDLTLDLPVVKAIDNRLAGQNLSMDFDATSPSSLATPTEVIPATPQEKPSHPSGFSRVPLHVSRGEHGTEHEGYWAEVHPHQAMGHVAIMGKGDNVYPEAHGFKDKDKAVHYANQVTGKAPMRQGVNIRNIHPVIEAIKKDFGIKKQHFLFFSDHALSEPGNLGWHGVDKNGNHTIHIDPSITRNPDWTAEVIGHEMAHAKQRESGQFKTVNGVHHWGGEPHHGTVYRDFPWEIDARKHEERAREIVRAHGIRGTNLRMREG